MKRIIIGLIMMPFLGVGQALKPEATPAQKNEIRRQLRELTAEMSPDTCAVRSYIGPYDLEKKIQKLLKDSVSLEGLKDCVASFGFSIVVNCDGQLMGHLWPGDDLFDECTIELAGRVADVIKRTKVDLPQLNGRTCNWLFENNSDDV